MKEVQRKIIAVLTFTAIISFWWWASYAMNNKIFLPSPTLVIDEIIELAKGDLWINIWMSFRRITLAILLAAVIAIPLGLLMSRIKVFRWIIDPITRFLSYAPVTAFSFLLIIFLGIDETSKIVLIFIAAFLQYLPIVFNEYQDMDHKIMDMAKSQGFSGLRLIWHVILPYTTPEILRNLISLYGIGWTYVVIAELTNAKIGLGHLIHIGGLRGDTKLVFASLVVIIAVNIVFNKVATVILHKLFSWRYGKGGQSNA